MNESWKVKAVYGVSAVGALFTLGLLWHAGGMKGLLSGFALWALLPYAGFCLAARVIKSAWFITALLVLTILSVAAGAYFYIDAMFIHIDAQGALIFLFMPLYQVLAQIALFSVFGFCKLAKRFQHGVSSG